MAYDYVVLFLINSQATDASIATMTILLILKKAGLLLNLARNIYLLVFQSNSNFTSCIKSKKSWKAMNNDCCMHTEWRAYLNENIIVHFLENIWISNTLTSQNTD